MALISLGQKNSSVTSPNIGYRLYYTLEGRNATHQQIRFYIQGTFYKGVGSTTSLGTGSNFGIYMLLQYSNGANISGGKIDFKNPNKVWNHITTSNPDTWRPRNSSDNTFYNIYAAEGSNYTSQLVAIPISSGYTSSTFSLKAGFFRTSKCQKNASGYIAPYAITVNLGPRPTYTISYYKNYGESSTELIGTDTIYQGDSTTLRAAVSRTGYTFSQWCTERSVSQSSTQYDASAQVTPSGNMVLYALWTVNKHYLDLNGHVASQMNSAYNAWIYTDPNNIQGFGTTTVTANGTTTPDVSDYYSELPYGSSYSFSSITPTTGHIYEGLYSGHLSGTMPDSNTTTVLQFRAIKYTLAYSANGGSGAPNSQPKVYGVDTRLSSTYPTRSLYDFRGWGTSSSGSASYQPGDTLSTDLLSRAQDDGGTAYLYAIWRISAPSNVRITSSSVTGPFSIDLSWACDGLSITKYVVHYKPTGGTELTKDCNTSTSTTLTVNEETTYEIWVTATNSTGSANSAHIQLTTPADQAKIRIHNGSTWLQGKAYVYDGSSWVKAKKVYIYDGSQWKINSNN